MNVIEFIDENVKLNEKGNPWLLSKHQRTVMHLMYNDGYTIRLWSEVKKSGKTFLAACIALWEAITNADTEVVCCANDEEQALSRVFQTVCQLIKYNSELEASATVQASIVKFSNGSVIRAVSSDYKGQAGGRQRLTIFDELWAFDLERMTRLFEEMTPPATETGAYILIVSYAGFTGEGELLEGLYRRGLAGKRVHRKLECYRAQGLFMFWSHQRRQPWQLGREGKAYYEEQARFLRPNTFARLHRNEWVSSESTFILGEQWDACVDPSRTPILTGARLFLGVDIGVKSDNAAVVGVCWDGKKLVLATHEVWRPTKAHPVNLQDVEDYILELKQRHRIVRLYADPSQAIHMLQRLEGKFGGRVVQEFSQTTANCTVMGETLYDVVKNRNLIAYESDEVREHVTNAVGVETPRGFRMAKEKARRKIDLAVALAMAVVAAMQAGAKAARTAEDIPLAIYKGKPAETVFAGMDTEQNDFFNQIQLPVSDELAAIAAGVQVGEAVDWESLDAKDSARLERLLESWIRECRIHGNRELADLFKVQLERKPQTERK